MLPDHLVPEWVVVGFLVHLVMQDFSFVFCDYYLVGLVLITEVLLEVRVRLWLVHGKFLVLLARVVHERVARVESGVQAFDLQAGDASDEHLLRVADLAQPFLHH